MSQPTGIACTPAPPYYAVIFTSRRTEGEHGYNAMAERMVALGSSYDGFLGIETARGADGLGVTVSYWRDEACRSPRGNATPSTRRPSVPASRCGMPTTTCVSRRSGAPTTRPKPVSFNR